MTNRASFDESFEDLYRLAYRVAYRILGSRLDAEDVAQEALARASVAWRKVDGYAPAWVSKVAADTAIDEWRRVRREARSRGPGDGPAEDRIAERIDLVEGLRKLPRRQREAVVLRYLADRPGAEVARALGVTEGTVKQHSSRGLDALRRHLSVVEEEQDV